jgi:hypothetical protein
MSLLGGDFVPNTEKLYVLKCKIFCEGLFCNPCLRTWIDALPVGDTHLYFQQEQSFSVRAWMSFL